MHRAIRCLPEALARQRGHLAEWVPVCLALGVGGFFSMRQEPGMPTLAALVAVLLALGFLGGRMAEDWRPLCTGAVLIGAGVLLAALRSFVVAGPVLDFRYYGPVEGRVVAVDLSASDAVRLTLDRVFLPGVEPSATPTRLRVSLHGTQGYIKPQPGLPVMMTAHLGPPGGPVEPGGFDFRRQAWFRQIGAVGYTRSPALATGPPDTSGAAIMLGRLRKRIAGAVLAGLPGTEGAFAAAVTTGDRTAMPAEAIDDLRAANLAHLLAISGLHMGLLTGVVLAALRLALVLIPKWGLRLPVKPLAAAGALLAGFGYLCLSGFQVATLRAFIMVAVVLVAVILGRRALTLRAVAVAASLILVLTPEALLGPGFQMSFAATVALIAAFRWLKDHGGPRSRRALRWAAALVMSSAVAGLATAPYAAAHFNRLSDYGLLANVLTVPLMGLAVMPGAVLALALAPFGAEHLGLALMAPAIRWILAVAAWVADLPGAVTPVTAPPPVVLPLLSLGGLWVVLWQGRMAERLPGVLAVAAALFLWAGQTRPDVLISETGGLVGVLGPEGRVLNKERGESFAAGAWLENDGDLATQQEAAFRPGQATGQPAGWFAISGRSLAAINGRNASPRAVEACGAADIVVLSATWPAAAPASCLVIDKNWLASRGATAIRYSDAESGPQITTARGRSGRRMWNDASVRRRVLKQRRQLAARGQWSARAAGAGRR